MVKPAALAGPAMSKVWMVCACPGAGRERTFTAVALAAMTYMILDGLQVRRRSYGVSSMYLLVVVNRYNVIIDSCRHITLRILLTMNSD